MRTLTAVFALAVSLAAPVLARAEEAGTRKAARAALSRYGPALVTVRLTVKSRMVYEGREHSGQESTMEVLGTVIAPDGLTVISDFTSNPEGLFQREGGVRVETETSEVVLVLRDGREFPARFVLRDAGLDVAFLAPVGNIPPLACVPFERAAVPEPLDDLVLLTQLGRSLNREVGVTLRKVRAVVKKPRTFVVPDAIDGLMSLGGPAFDGKGRPVGLVVLRRAPGGPGNMESFRDLFEAMTAVVLSAADVQEVASQAVAARARAAALDGAATP
jgi:hypothetical protein